MTVVRGLSWDHPRGRRPMLATSEEWSAEHPDVRLEWTARSLADFAGGSLDGYIGTHDLVAIDYPTVGEAVAAGWIVPLEDVLPLSVVQRLTAGSVDAFGRPYVFDGRAWAAPLDAAALCAAYRPDLLETPPTTVAQLVDLAHDSGRVAVPLSVFSTVATFLSFCVQQGAEPFADDGFLDRSVGLATLEALTELVKVVPSYCFEEGAVQLMDRLTTSDELAYVGYVYGYSTYARRDATGAAVRFAGAPALVAGSPTRPTLGGVGLAVLREAPSVDAAAAYLAWVAGEESQRGVFTRSGGQPAHAAAWDDPTLDDLTGGFFSATGPSLREAYVRPNAAWFGEVQPLLGARLREHLRRGGDPEALLDELDTAVDRRRSTSTGGHRGRA